jgi:arylsulfatase A-like enzyme
VIGIIEGERVMHCFGSWVSLCVLAVGVDASVAANNAAEKPNIIVIVGDDMGYADLGVHGCRDIPTPNLDALANGGVRFTNGYVSGPYCSPTRAGLLTGRYQTRFGHEFNPGGDGPATPKGLPLSEKTIADRLKAAGYATGLIGKWHLGNTPEYRPQRRGFDEFFGFLGGAHSYRAGEGAPILRGNKPVEENEYMTDAFAREAIDFVERHRESPFFLYLAFNAVHTPMHATDERLEKFASIDDPKRRTYAAMMSAMDDAIGEVLAKVKASGLEDDTLVFFISDNGGPMLKGTTVNGSINEPLRGSKRTTLEGGVRVPFFVKWPGHVPAGKVFEKPAIQLDFLPTALAAAGIETLPDWKLDGVDLMPYVTGETSDSPHDALYWKFGQQMAIRQGDWKLVKYDPVVDGAKGKATAAKLYNLAADVGESHDVIAEQPEKAAELQTAWDTWNNDNVPAKWGEGGKGKAKAKGKGKRRAARQGT